LVKLLRPAPLDVLPADEDQRLIGGGIAPHEQVAPEADDDIVQVLEPNGRGDGVVGARGEEDRCVLLALFDGVVDRLCGVGAVRGDLAELAAVLVGAGVAVLLLAAAVIARIVVVIIVVIVVIVVVADAVCATVFLLPFDNGGGGGRNGH
jgi:hypothetical protein